MRNVIFVLALFFCFGLIRYQNSEIKRVEFKLDELSRQMKDSEAECKRMTDTCIDIITNRRWENGE